MSQRLESVAAKLRPLLTTNPLAPALFDLLGTRLRPRGVNDIRRIRQELAQRRNTAVALSSLIELFEAFQRAGAGKLHKAAGSGDNPRFKWADELDSIDLASLVTGKTYRTLDNKETRNRGIGGEGGPRPGFVRVVYPFRDTILSFDVPADASKAEMRGVADFIGRFGK